MPGSFIRSSLRMDEHQPRVTLPFMCLCKDLSKPLLCSLRLGAFRGVLSRRALAIRLISCAVLIAWQGVRHKIWRFANSVFPPRSSAKMWSLAVSKSRSPHIAQRPFCHPQTRMTSSARKAPLTSGTTGSWSDATTLLMRSPLQSLPKLPAPRSPCQALGSVALRSASWRPPGTCGTRPGPYGRRRSSQAPRPFRHSSA